MTMERDIDGKPTAANALGRPWGGAVFEGGQGIVGCGGRGAASEPMPDLDALLTRAVGHGMFGDKNAVGDLAAAPDGH